VGDDCILAINKLNFSVEKGEFVVILGPSGSGKSTLLNLIGGMDYATDGEINIDGENITSFSKRLLNKYRRKSVGFVFQFYNLLPNLTAGENVALSKKISDNPLDGNVLELVGLGNRSRHFPSELSGGEQQRVSIARAIVKNPKLLLCDEPTGALDSETGKSIISTLWNMCKENNQTAIVVTHNSVIAESADKVIRLKDGVITKIEKNDAPKPIEEVDW
jgi:putative ABC transport system ATP-binding protein